MKLNLAKCAFRVASGKFLGFMVSSRGIEANPEKARAILDELTTRGNRVAIFRSKELTHLQSLISRLESRLNLLPGILANPSGLQDTTCVDPGPTDMSQTGSMIALECGSICNGFAPGILSSEMTTVDNELMFNFDLSDELFDCSLACNQCRLCDQGA